MPRTTKESPAFEVIALVASAGGLDALRTVLRDMPEGLPAAVIVAQHLGGQGSTLVEILGRHTKLPVVWASSGLPLTPGRVFVCPPRRLLEVLPDGTCAVGDGTVGAQDRPLDVLLQSLADSYGPRGVAVVLTGMGRDAAAGAAAIRRAGGAVLAQSEDTAEQPSMPRAVIQLGAADLVLPLHEIGAVIADVVRTGQLPRSRDEIEAAEVLFAGDGEVRQQLRTIDWASTSLGPMTGWPVSLRTTLRLVLESSVAMCVLWGDDFIQLYNDHYRVLMGDKHPAGLGQSNRDSWPEVWHLVEPIYARVRAGEPVTRHDALYPITRSGAVEDAWFDLSFTPVRNETGAVTGILAIVVETTARVLSQRRLRTLQQVTASTVGATTVHAALQQSLASLAGSGGSEGTAQDVPYALGYLVDDRNRRAQLVSAIGVEPGGPMAPRTVDLRAGHPAWPLPKVLAAAAAAAAVGSALRLDGLGDRFRGARVGPFGDPPGSALLLPLRVVSGDPPAGVLVCGVNPRLPLDDAYAGFIELIAARVSASLAEARIRQRERQQMERLAELDRAKMEFFGNVSHEFRTPLTLLLGPLEELSRRGGELPAPLAADIQLATRNARRLLNQVDTLLDFSKAEARQLRARFEPVDLAELTRDIASVFRSAAERAGLTLRLTCPPVGEPVWVDPRMWEKIVGNLLSNALKFTVTGEIAVELRPRARHAELVVRDTGVGIPAAERRHIFTRFHQVRGHRGRSNDGVGIGLALVKQLVELHQGRVRVDSQEGRGTSFTVWMPMGRRPRVDADAPPDGTGAERPRVAATLAETAERWTPEAPGGVAEDPLGPPRRTVTAVPTPADARVLVVDDNRDMRDYLRRLLSGWDVTAVGDVPSALAALARAKPDVLLTDVMMPVSDGFELLQRVRGDPALADTPVVLLTARAGDDAAIEGLRRGADEYIAKPFSPRELVARLEAIVHRSRIEAELRRSSAWLRGQHDALKAAIGGAPLGRSLGVLVRTAIETFGEGTRAAFYLDNEPEQVADFPIAPDCWRFPITTAGGTFVGTFVVALRQPRDAMPRDLELASLLTQTAAIVIAHHRDSEVRRRAEDELRRARGVKTPQ